MYTTIYGPWYGGSGKGRFVVDIEDIGTVTKDTTSVVVRSNWYLEFSQPTWDASNVFDPGGSFESANISPVYIGTSSNPVTRMLIWEKDITVNLQYGTETGIQVKGQISGINNVGVTVYVDQWFNLPARPYQLPNPASNFTNTYVNDNKVDLSWVANYTGSDGATPWHNQYIDRTSTGEWADATQVAALGWEPTNWTDTTLQPNKRYNYRHRASNSAGSSPYAYASNSLYTKPAAPNKPTFAKQADGSVKITAKNNSPWATKYRIDDSADGSTWTTLTSSGTISALGTDIVHTQSSPNNAVTHRYRVMVQTPDGKWSAASPTSDILQLQAPPNPPAWAAIAQAFDATSAITTPWTHNPVDSTPQTAYEVQWRSSADNGATWTAWTTTGKVTSTTSSRTWAANTFPQNRLIEMQVRTWGAHTTASSWSATATIRTSAKPTTGVVFPASNADVPAKRITAAWNYSDAEGSAQSAWRVNLYSAAGALLGTWQGSGRQTTFAIPYDLEDDTAYRVGIQVRDGAHLWSAEASSTFSVDYLPPPAPVFSASWDEEKAAAILTIGNPAPRVNLVANPSFETDLVKWYVGTNSGALSSYSTGSQWRQRAGGKSLMLTASGTIARPSAYFGSTPLPAGTTSVTMAMGVTTEQATVYEVAIQITWKGDTGTVLSYSTSDFTTAPFYAGKRLVLTAAVPAGATQVNGSAIMRRSDSGMVEAGRRMWVDAVTLEAGETDGSWFVNGMPPAVSNNIYRDGLLIAEGYPLNTAFVDPLPNTSGSTYVVEAVSALPSGANSEPATLPFNLDVYRRFWLNGGNGWRQVASYYGNVNRDHTTELAGDEEHYSGRTLPVLTIGEAVTETFGFSTTVEQIVDNPANFHALVRTPGVVCFREPSGRYFVSLRRVSEGTTQSFTAEMSFSMKIVDYKEGVTE